MLYLFPPYTGFTAVNHTANQRKIQSCPPKSNIFVTKKRLREGIPPAKAPLFPFYGFPVIAGLRLRFFRPPVPTALQDLRAGRHILLRRHQSKISVRVLGAQKHALGLDSRKLRGL